MMSALTSEGRGQNNNSVISYPDLTLSVPAEIQTIDAGEHTCTMYTYGNIYRGTFGGSMGSSPEDVLHLYPTPERIMIKVELLALNMQQWAAPNYTPRGRVVVQH